MNQKTFILEILLSAIYLKALMTSQSAHIFQGILCLLLYLCIKILFYIFKAKKAQLMVLLISILFIMGVAVFTSVPLELFLLLNSMQLFINVPIIGMLVILYYFNVEPSLQSEFLSLSVLIIFIEHLLSFYDRAHRKLNTTLEDLQYNLSSLNKKYQLAELYDTTLTYTTRLEERQLITQQLHDELGHVLSGNTMQLEAALLMLDHEPKKSYQMITRVISNLRKGTESIREILKAIQPKINAISIENIKKLALETEEVSGMVVQLHYDHLINDISYIHWQIILLNIKEALTNAMKYSKATKCDITFERLNYQYKICIKDNGIGQKNIHKGMGLKGIQQRTVDINGQVIFDGSQGFSITLLLPIERKPHD